MYRRQSIRFLFMILDLLIYTPTQSNNNQQHFEIIVIAIRLFNCFVTQDIPVPPTTIHQISKIYNLLF